MRLNLVHKYCVCIVIAIVTIIAIFYAKYQLSTLGGPRILCPRELDLGEYENGIIARACIDITNCGTDDLVIDNIKANCSCTGFELRKGNEYVRVTMLIIPPNSTVNVYVDITVGGVAIGRPMINAIRFTTNDSQNPEYTTHLKVTRVHGGISSSPEHLALGMVRQYDKITRSVFLFDTSITPRKVLKVVNTSPEQIICHLQESSIVDEHVPVRAGRYIGKITVDVNTSHPGEIDGELSIYIEGREQYRPDNVRILGKILAPVEITPSVLTLPRTSLAGPVNESIVVLRVFDASPYEFVSVTAPDGWKVKMLDKHNNTIRFKVTLINSTSVSIPKDNVIISFTTAHSGSIRVTELPVYRKEPVH